MHKIAIDCCSFTYWSNAELIKHETDKTLLFVSSITAVVFHHLQIVQ